MYDSSVILRLLPHRYPFLFIDGIREHEFQKRAVCTKMISFSEEVFQGHFPGKPIYPGVLMIEMGLQTTQVMLTDIEKSLSQPEDTGAVQGFFIAVDKFKFQKIVRPGDVLEIESTLHAKAMGMAKANISIKNQAGDVVASGSVSVGAA